MEEKMTIKETKEFVEAMFAISLVLTKHFADGVQGGDFAAIWAEMQSNSELREKLALAYEDYRKIPAEIKDIDIYEGMELATCSVTFIPKLIKVLREAKES